MSAMCGDFITQVKQGILWRYWEVAAFMFDLVAKVVAVVA